MRQIPNVVDRALQEAGISMEQDLDQTQFVDVYRKAVLAVVKYLKAKPLTVAHTEKVFDGSSISNLIKDKKALDLVSDGSSSKYEESCILSHRITPLITFLLFERMPAYVCFLRTFPLR